MDIKLTSKDKKYVHCPDDVFGIMQRILLRENKIDKEKEHFWIIGLDVAAIFSTSNWSLWAQLIGHLSNQ